MKKIVVFWALLLFSLLSFADYTGVITTSSSDLIFNKQDGYDVLTLPNGEYTSIVGSPLLPVKTFTYLIPADVSVSGITVTSNSVVQLNGNYNILPVQEPIPTNVNPATVMFNEQDTVVYGNNNPYPSVRCEIINDGFARGYHIITLVFYPVEYLPLSGVVKLHTSISFTINYGAGNSNQCIRPLQQSEYSYENTKSYIKALVDNKSDMDNVSGGALKIVGSGTQIENLRGLQPTSMNFIPDYVIITKEEFIPSFQDLAEWKTKKGVYTIVVDVDDIYNSYQGCDQQEKIRNYIKDAYLNWGISYVLLGGDTEIIPVRFVACEEYNLNDVSKYTESDIYYAGLDGNWNSNYNNYWGENYDNADLYADVFVGRSPSINISDASTFVNKIISYETFQSTNNKSYVKNSLFVAANLSPSPDNSNGLRSICESLNNLTATSGFLDQQYYYTLKLYDKSNDGNFYNSDQPENGRYFELSSENFINALNTGWSSFGQSYGKFHLVYHMDHSSFNAMGASSKIKGESIFRNDADDLLNGMDYLHIIYSDGCHPNEFSKNSISEHFINNENGGCVAFLGNSNAGWSNDYIAFINYFCTPLYSGQEYHIGNLNAMGNFNNLNSYMRKNRNLLGDPEMPIWTDTPLELTVSASYSNTNKTISGTISGFSFPSGTTSIPVTICAWKDNEIYAVKYITATSNSVNFSMQNIYPNTSGNIALTVSAHNYIPKTIDVSAIISGANPYIASIGINDSGTGGNGDNQADAGESLSLALIVANSGTNTASNVTAELSIDSNSSFAPYITIINGTSSFGNIVANSTNTTNTPFTITINKDIFEVLEPQRPNSCHVEFCVTLKQNNTVFSHRTYNLQVFEPSISKGENIVETNGQSSSLLVKLYNMGYAEATGLTATLSLSDANQTGVSITAASSSYPNIDKVSSVDNSEVGITPFAITLANGIQLENIAFKLEISNAFGKTWTFDNFYIVTPMFNVNNCSIDHTSDETSINLSWNISTNSTISGYNVYRSSTANGTYERANTNIISYRAYMDENLERMTDYYYKVTFVDNNGNESEGYPVDGYRASTSFGMHEGWPISISQSYGTEAWGSPVAYDVFNDNKKEIFFTTGVITSSNETNGGLWGFKEDGDRWLYADGNLTNYSPIVNLGYSSLATPAIADIEGDGEAEIVVTTNLEGNNNGLNMVSYKSITGNTNDNNQCAIDFGPVQLGGGIVPQSVLLTDINNDGKFESMATTQFLHNNTGGLKVLAYNGTGLYSKSLTCGYSMPVAYDIGNSSDKEIIMCTEREGIYVYNYNGTDYGTNPRVSSISGWANDYPPILADIDNNGVMDLMFLSVEILQSGNSRAKICAVETNNFTYLSGWNPTNVQCPTVNLTTHRKDSYHSQNVPLFSVGDLNKDGSLDVVYGSAGVVYIYNSNGILTNSIPIVDYEPWIRTIPILADVDDDNSDLEIIVSSYSNTSHLSKIYAFKMDGTLVSGFPLSIPIEIKNSPCVDDIDNDGLNELIVTTAEKVYVWDTYGDCSNNFYGWTMYRRDAQNTATYPICECSEVTTTITQDQIWDNNRNLKGDLEISANTTLTVTGTLKMAENAKIIVHPKGKFIVDGGTITNLCPGKMWRGIRVLGDKNKRQLANYQGTLEIKNGSVISNAKDAISTWDGEHYSTSGGIVKCTNSTFLNNRRSAEFMAYINHTSTGSETSNVSYFKNCNFTIDDNNIFTEAGVTYSDIITMWGVNGVAIRGCHFSDVRTGSPARGNAITLASAGTYIKPSCTYGDYSADFPCFCTGESNNTFSGFTKGVNAENTGTNYPFNVFKADFENCGISVYSNAVNNYNVTLSDFEMNCSSLFTETCGIYSESSTGYKIEGNDFYTTYTANPNGFNSLGIIINNSGTDANSIYRNTFDKLTVGVGSATNNNSLQVLCNEFSNNYLFDIWASPSISPTQGTSSESAGNKFSSGCYNFVSENSNITYYHSGANNSTNNYCPYNSINVTKIPNITANECEPTICLLPTPIDPPIIIGPILGKSAPVNDDIALYESLQQIYESRFAEYNNAGYGFLLENFEENDADIVAMARLKQDTLITIHRAMAEIANRNIYAILQDTLVFDREALNGWYNRINTQTAKYSLVNSYFEVGEYALARQELASIPQRFALTTDELAEYDNFCKYQSLRESVYSSRRNFAQLTEDEIAELQRVVERNTGVSSAYANSVLCFFYGICRDEELDLDFDMDAPMNSKSTTAVAESDAEQLAIYVYPNPADEELNILLNSLPEGRTTIEFHDVTGRLVLSEEIKSNSTSINISSLRQGVYMYRIVNGDNVIARDRIVKE